MNDIKQSLSDTEKLNLAGAKAKGQRPYFLAEKQTEQVLSVTMALAMELSVTRERLASLECLLEEKGVVSKKMIDNYKPGKQEVARRSVETQEYLARILRIMQQDKEEMEANDPTMEEIQEELTKV
jgi:predicted  nucleic acid-binding Zn-ribbon protein